MRNQSSVGLGLVRAGRRRLPLGRAALVALTTAMVGAGALAGGPSAASAADTCPNAKYRGGQSAHLADCRAYEQVSPVNKNGGDVTLTAWGPPNVNSAPPQLWQSSTDGKAIAYLSRSAFAGAPSGMPLNPYVARRNAAGWSSESIGAPMNASNQNATNLLSYNRYLAFSPDLSHGIFSHLAPNGPLLAPGAVLGYPNLYARNLQSGDATALTPVTPPGFPPQLILATYRTTYRGASGDLSHVIFTAPDRLTPDAPSTCFNTASDGSGCLYEWVDGHLRLVNVLPNGVPSDTGDAGGSGFLSARNLVHAISTDGSKIYWTAQTGAIYVRINGSRTEPVGNGQFWAASPDGVQALYTADDGHLYRFDLSTGVSTDLFPSLPPGHGSVNLVGASDDLSFVYFTADAALYLRHGGTNHFIVAPGDTGTGNGIDSRIPTQRDSYVTPDGRHLAFVSNSSLTGYDNTPAEPSECIILNLQSRPCPQVFYYDAEDDQLSCASCNPSGDRPHGYSFIQAHYDAGYAPRVLSDDGDHLFFNSLDDLVAGDTNGQQDVYEWRPNGVGDCARAGGCINLISGGTGGVPNPDDPQSPRNFFVDASADGKDVFFTTQEQLLPSDPSADADLYDARMNGGIAAQHVAANPECQGDGCRGPVAVSPSLPSIGSVSFVGAGVDPLVSKPLPDVSVSVSRVKAVRGAKAQVKAKVPGAGRLRTSGSGLRRSYKTAKKAGTYRVSVRLSKRSQRTLKRKHRVKVRVTVRFSPHEGRRAVRRMHVTFKAQKPRHGKGKKGGR